MTLRTAVIGVGSLGRHHARLHARLALENRLTFVGVCDSNEPNARLIAAEHNVVLINDWRKLLTDESLRVDAVSLATPTESHAEIACALLEAGVHVLVEKPIALTLAEADRMIEAATRGRAILQIGHLERFNPALVALRPYVRAPLYFEIHRVGQFTARSLDIDVVLDLMIHDLDIVQWLVGYEHDLREIHAVGIPVLTNRVDAANARLVFANGAVANITASRVGTEKIRKMRFFQPHDYVVVDYHTRFASISSLAAPSPAVMLAAQNAQANGIDAATAFASAVHTTRPEVHDIEPLRAEIEAFLDAVQNNSASPIPGWQGRRALGLAARVLESIHTHAAQAGVSLSS
ncbi:MAG: Gfo/Idh/MocA family oxidoreductase [Pyrinomonadaceae bacterium MAG19_C2-C3]|nr:Gfo/Idh/MocA family oxidoreductase [Pyrinomonadaceae bacterium MAG19_C2-C3]